MTRVSQWAVSAGRQSQVIANYEKILLKKVLMFKKLNLYFIILTNYLYPKIVLQCLIYFVAPVAFP